MTNTPATSLSTAARFWERGRLTYNLALTATAIVWFAQWPHVTQAIKPSDAGRLMVLALLANLCYCAAYLIDLAIQQLPNLQWTRYRWILFALGTLFAVLLESYWINDEIYPDFIHAASTLLRSTPCCPLRSPAI
jgi:hypothetical protein